MKDTMTISLDREVKQKFSSFAQSLGTNPTNLLNMMIVHSMNTKSITFQTPEVHFEIEQFSKNELDDIQKSGTMKSGIKEMNTLLSNV
ncbi:hypothetical protein N9J72_01440 [Candidatus Gracilibacteria bacterium]|nr:hypothetical protein [Candidatus Gracilibacteria bacterium]